jgi:hypothetical protein
MFVGVAVCITAMGGCNETAINKNREDTMLTATDLVTMTDDMAAKIASDPEVAQITSQKPMVIVMQRVENQTMEIMPHPQAEIYLARVRALLSEKQVLRRQFTFVLNKNTYEQLKLAEGAQGIDLGQDQDRLVPEYALKAVFYSDTKETNKSRSDYYLCTYQLTKIGDRNAGHIIWEGKYETKKKVVKGFLD